MPAPRPYAVQPGWRLLLRDAGLSPANVLRRAGLPADLLSGGHPTMPPEAYHRLLEALEAEAGEPTLALRLGAAISVEVFDPPLFAAFCSPDLNTAAQRIARFKPLIGPMRLEVAVGPSRTSLTLQWLGPPPPAVVVLTELVFFVQLARLGTRERVEPLEVTSPHGAEPRAPYARYFGVPVQTGRRARLVFRAEDAARPFLTASEAMWRVFEPELRRRLEDLERDATTADRVHAALLELLPGGAPPMAEVARRLGTSARTLQRRLQEEGHSYQGVLDRTRQELAGHYLKNTSLRAAEISYLLGFEDPNCFSRAYRGWTGTTPSEARALAAAG